MEVPLLGETTRIGPTIQAGRLSQKECIKSVGGQAFSPVKGIVYGRKTETVRTGALGPFWCESQLPTSQANSLSVA